MFHVALCIQCVNGEYLMDLDENGNQLDHEGKEIIDAEDWCEIDSHMAVIEIDRFENEEQLKEAIKRVAEQHSLKPENVSVLKLDKDVSYLPV